MANPGIKAALRAIERPAFWKKIEAKTQSNHLGLIWAFLHNSLVRRILARCKKHPLLVYRVLERLEQCLKKNRPDVIIVTHMCLLRCMPVPSPYPDMGWILLMHYKRTKLVRRLLDFGPGA